MNQARHPVRLIAACSCCGEGKREGRLGCLAAKSGCARRNVDASNKGELMLGLIIGSLLFGLILGPLARLVLPGRQPIGLLWTFGAGFLGALVGGLVAAALGFGDNDDNVDWIRILIQLVCAVIAVAAVAASKTGRGSRV